MRRVRETEQCKVTDVTMVAFGVIGHRLLAAESVHAHQALPEPTERNRYRDLERTVAIDPMFCGLAPGHGVNALYPQSQSGHWNVLIFGAWPTWGKWDDRIKRPSLNSHAGTKFRSIEKGSWKRPVRQESERQSDFVPKDGALGGSASQREDGALPCIKRAIEAFERVDS
jgi:hypothetical protein